MVRAVLVVVLDAPPPLRRVLVTCRLARRVRIRFAPGKMTQEATLGGSWACDSRAGAVVFEGPGQRLQSTAPSTVPWLRPECQWLGVGAPRRHGGAADGEDKEPEHEGRTAVGNDVPAEKPILTVGGCEEGEVWDGGGCWW